MIGRQQRLSFFQFHDLRHTLNFVPEHSRPPAPEYASRDKKERRLLTFILFKKIFDLLRFRSIIIDRYCVLNVFDEGGKKEEKTAGPSAVWRRNNKKRRLQSKIIRR